MQKPLRPGIDPYFYYLQKHAGLIQPQTFFQKCKSLQQIIIVFSLNE